MKANGWKVLVLLAVLTGLSACSHQEEAMQSQLDHIRLMVKQSAVLAVQVACAAPESRSDLIRASVTLLRRAMGGEEMASIHKMMGKIPDTADGMMVMKANEMDDSAEMKMHVAIHDAGEDVFALLDVLGGTKSPTCADIQPAQLAAAAALMREQQNPEITKLEQQLDAHGKHFMRSDIPDAVWQLAQALTRI